MRLKLGIDNLQILNLSYGRLNNSREASKNDKL